MHAVSRVCGTTTTPCCDAYCCGVGSPEIGAEVGECQSLNAQAHTIDEMSAIRLRHTQVHAPNDSVQLLSCRKMEDSPSPINPGSAMIYSTAGLANEAKNLSFRGVNLD